MNREPVDPVWNEEFHQRGLRAMATPELSGVEILSSRCGGPYCRMDVHVPPTLTMGALAMTLGEQGRHGGVWCTSEPTVISGQEKAACYEAQPGHLLPAMQATE